jgi:hypothetical protein
MSNAKKDALLNTVIKQQWTSPNLDGPNTDPIRVMYVELEDGLGHYEIFQFFPCEIKFKQKELVGLSIAAARELKEAKVATYLEKREGEANGLTPEQLS